MQHQALLENYLKQLHLSTFLQNYQIYAQDAARTDLPYERYLLALCAAEVNQRDVWRVERAIQAGLGSLSSRIWPALTSMRCRTFLNNAC